VLDKLLCQHHDLAGMQLDMPYYLKDSFQHREVPPGPRRLWVDDSEKLVLRKRPEDVADLFHGGVEGGVGLGGGGGGREGELVVAAADIGLARDAVDHPLAHIAGEMQQKVGDGVLVVAATVPHLVLGELGNALGDLTLSEFEASDGEGEEVSGDGLHGRILPSE